MLGNTLRMVFRLFARSRAYSAITVGGLALGLAGCLMILGYVRYEQSYDGWLADHGRIYQVQTTIRPPGQPVLRTQASPFPLRALLPAGFPQIEAMTSASTGKTVTEQEGQPRFIDATTVDGTFFKVLGLPFARGSAETALPDTNSIVLTQSEARRFYGTDDVVGRTLALGAGEGKRPYRVTGVLRDLPRNTSLKLALLFRVDPAFVPYQGWGNINQQHFVKLRPGADAAAINAALPAWEKRAIPPETIDGKPADLSQILDFALVSLRDVHLGAAQEGAVRPGGDPRSLATFTIIALLTLGMAVMNFVNLTTARAAQRAREVALRKVLGASRWQLIRQFLGESVVIAAVAMLIALSIAELATPWIARLLEADLQLTYLGDLGMALPALGLFALTALAGGLYPAFYLSRFKPAAVLREANRASAETRGSGRLRAALVLVQFAIAIGLIASTSVIWSQTRFVETVDPGYRRDGLIQITNGWRFTKGAEYEAARKEMLAIPGVTATGRTGLALASVDKSTRLMRGAGDKQYISMGFFGIDAEFLQTMDIPLIAGRLLGDRIAADRIAGETPQQLAQRGINVVVNRTAARDFGYRSPQDAVGKTVQVAFDGWVMVPATIAGVVEDTRFRTARDALEPTLFAYETDRTSEVLVRYANARPGEVMAALNKVWRKHEPEIPFEARFADDIVRELYAADRARTLLFAGFSLLAVLIACLGLYSLAAFATERRTREIGIRKVLGAKVRDIVRLLAWQFSKPVVLANLIAWPVAWWAMRDWLNTFDARIPLTIGPFAVAGILAFAIAIATVAGQSIRVARMNPIHALRYE